MKISLKRLRTDEPEVCEEEVQPEDLDIDIGIMHFPEALTVRAEACRSGDDLTVDSL